MPVSTNFVIKTSGEVISLVLNLSLSALASSFLFFTSLFLMLLPGPPNAQVSKETEIHADSKPRVFLCTHYGLGAP